MSYWVNLYFDSIKQIQGHVTRWIWRYNYERPHRALGGDRSYVEVSYDCLTPT
ncbi:MAG: integrase core domain-containing protein [Candidatus Symbiodolus clandestinus]